MAEPLSIVTGAVALVTAAIGTSQSLIKGYSYWSEWDKNATETKKTFELHLAVFQQFASFLESRKFQPKEDDLVNLMSDAVKRSQHTLGELQKKLNTMMKVCDSDTKESVRATVRRYASRFVFQLGPKTWSNLLDDVERKYVPLKQALDVLSYNLQGLHYSSSQEAKLRDLFGTPDFDSIYITARSKHHGQTGQWFINDKLFVRWLEKGPSFLWARGFIGCGKTHMCATAIDHLQNHHLRQSKYHELKTGVAFFFFFNQSPQQDDCGMLRSLLWQLSDKLNDGHTQLTELYASKQNLTRDVLGNCLHAIMEEFSKIFILIDGLDEITAEETTGVLSTIEMIRKWNLPCLHLLVTSRDFLNIRNSLKPRQDEVVIMKNAAIQQDIANYIGHRLETHPILKKYKERHGEIQDLISERAQSAFKYADCLFDHIGQAASLSQLNTLLSSLPGSLDDAYEGILSKIPKAGANDAGRILRILCLSNRPLTVNELTHALAVDLGQNPRLNIEQRLVDIDTIHFMFGCLVELTWKKGLFAQGYIIIQVAHLSVREYLESEKIRRQPKVSMFAIEHNSAHMEIAQTCLLYILDPKISQREQSQVTLMEFPFASYAAKEWLYHYTSSDPPRSGVKKLVVELFMDRGGCFDTWIQLRDLGHPWKRATAIAGATDNHTTPLYHACLLGLAEIAAELVTFYDVNAPGGRYGNALQAAISQGHIDVVCTLLDGSPDVDIGEKISSTEQAILPERQETEKQMLPNTNNSINVNAHGGEYGTSLIAASYNGNRELVSMLLRKGSKINDQVGQYGNALIAASSAGHSKIVQTLLDKSASINSRGGIFGNAFYAASFGGHTNVLQVLLKSGADINAEDGQFGTALGSASLGGHMAAVQILVDHGADVNASSGRLGSALQAASLVGHIELVKYLLDKGADVNASGGRFGNALQAASFGTRESMAEGVQQIVRAMLSQGVPVLPQNSNALQVASFDAYLWDETMLKRISEAVLSMFPKDLSAVDSGMRNPLLDAFLIDRGALVRLLLKEGADVNAPGGEYGSALQAASSQGLGTVVKILLEADADVQASGGLHGSALELASNQNHEGVVKMLQEATSSLLPTGSHS